MTRPPSPDVQYLTDALRGEGHVRLHAEETLGLLADHGADADWTAFRDSWNEMPIDGYLADGGRYRRRRHANYRVEADGGITRQAHRPHYQSRDYNPLHGGIERWFEPVDEQVGASRGLRAILDACRAQFGRLRPDVGRWFVEVHQFRIEAFDGQAGLPTPEGMHRDGVDFVLVLLIRRQNVRSGVTRIQDADGRCLGSFTLTEPFDAMFVDDRRVYHGVTPVQPLDPDQPAWRDVLVVTFRADDAAAAPGA